MSEYRNQVNNLAGGTSSSAAVPSSASSAIQIASGLDYGSSVSAQSNYSVGGASSASQIISEIFKQVDQDRNGTLSALEAELILLRLNSRLGRQSNNDDVKQFLAQLERNGENRIDLNEFRIAIESLL